MALLSSKRTLLIVGVLVAVLVLYILGSAKRKDAAQPAADTNQCRVTVTADVLRVHAGPELASKVVDRLTKGQETNADKLVQNGFRKIGDNRWVAVDFALPLAGRDCG